MRLKKIEKNDILPRYRWNRRCERRRRLSTYCCGLA